MEKTHKEEGDASCHERDDEIPSAEEVKRGMGKSALDDTTEALLEEIDEVLKGTDAEAFVQAFRQQGGQ